MITNRDPGDETGMILDNRKCSIGHCGRPVIQRLEYCKEHQDASDILYHSLTGIWRRKKDEHIS